VLYRFAVVDAPLDVLRRSTERLRRLVTPLDDEQIERSAYPSAWTIAGVLSHIGSGAVIMQRRLDDGLRGETMPDSFAPTVWDTWNAKSPRAKADDALVSDRALVERVEEVTDDERERFEFTIGPMTFGYAGFVTLRLNEHTLHSWDIEVALDPSATLAGDAVPIVVDNLELVGRFTARPTGADRTIAVRTTDPSRDFTILLTPERVTFTPGGDGRAPDLTMPAEAFVRLAYGRLDPEHTPTVEGDVSSLDELRRAFPGP
jgi:uncharacterized protein (TIGR03083 family)